jgi:hypothetical protein
MSVKYINLEQENLLYAGTNLTEDGKNQLKNNTVDPRYCIVIFGPIYKKIS